jgi:hypothetical protein
MVDPQVSFNVNRGLCQGCPLSPLLFIIVVEYLSRNLEKERDLGNLPGMQITRGVRNMNHSQFIDDTLLLGGDSIIIATRFKRILDSFLDASGGAVNNKKCQIYGCHTSSLSYASNCSSFPILALLKIGLPSAIWEYPFPLNILTLRSSSKFWKKSTRSYPMGLSMVEPCRMINPYKICSLNSPSVSMLNNIGS